MQYKGFMSLRNEEKYRGCRKHNFDLNDRANIGRKVLPELFTGVVDSSSVIVIRHPDYDS